MKENQQAVISVLRILDFNKVKEFYIDWLGFTIDWQYQEGETFLCIWEFR